MSGWAPSPDRARGSAGFVSSLAAPPTPVHAGGVDAAMTAAPEDPVLTKSVKSGANCRSVSAAISTRYAISCHSGKLRIWNVS
jgi:hypothetical protein